MKDELLVSLLKQGIRALDKQIERVVYDEKMMTKIKMRTDLNTKLFWMINELNDEGLLEDAESKRTFRRLKKEYIGE